MPRSILPLALGLSLLLAACSGGAGGSPGEVVHPGGDQLVLRVAFHGGFVAPQVLLNRLPTFTLLGDGRVIVEGAQIELYPGPALPAVLVRKLTEEGIQAVLADALASGALATSAELRGAQNFIADAPDTVFTLHAGGKEVTVTVYALNEFDTGSTNGLSAEEVATHRALSHLNERLGSLEQWLPASAWADSAWATYIPDALRLVVRDATSDEPDESGIENQLVAWPGSSDPASFGSSSGIDGLRCGVVSGEEAAGWYAALSSANELTRFTHGDQRFQVTPRQLLPDEAQECPQPLS